MLLQHHLHGNVYQIMSVTDKVIAIFIQTQNLLFILTLHFITRLEIYTQIAHLLNLAQNYVQMYYLISTDMKTLNDSNIIQLTDILQVLKIVIVIVVVYAVFHLFTQSICFILQHQSFANNTLHV